MPPPAGAAESSSPAPWVTQQASGASTTSERAMDAVGNSLYAYESLDYDEAEKDFIYARAELTPDARRSFMVLLGHGEVE